LQAGFARQATVSFHFQIKNVLIFDLKMESVTSCHAEMRSISSDKAKQRLRRSRQIKTAMGAVLI
jgi:hypothetical protein